MRDDLTGFGFGGSKSRQLDFLLADALNRGINTIIAVGENQSNFCRMAASFGMVNNMEVHLVLGGKNPQSSTGNLWISIIMGTTCHYIDSCDSNLWLYEAELLEKKLFQQGKHVYRMPLGGATPIGVLGYVNAFREILEGQDKLNLTFDHIFHATASSGTQAGLIVGKEVSGWKGSIIGISIAEIKEIQEQSVLKLARETGQLLGVEIEPSSVLVDDRFFGKGYGIKTPACIYAVELFARKCGIILDYTYTGKAGAGLLEYLENDNGHSSVLFIHTGGNISLFA